MNTIATMSARGRVGAAALCIVAAFVACGGKTNEPGDSAADASQEPDCSAFAGPNCWTTDAASIATCLQGIPAWGTFSADRTACTYSDGSVVRFDAPAPRAPTGSIPSFSFSLTRGSRTCVQLAYTANSLSVTGPDGTVSTGTSQQGDVIHCPAGAEPSSIVLDWSCRPSPPQADMNWREPGDSFQLVVRGAGVSPLILIACQ